MCPYARAPVDVHDVVAGAAVDALGHALALVELAVAVAEGDEVGTSPLATRWLPGPASMWSWPSPPPMRASLPTAGQRGT